MGRTRTGLLCTVLLALAAPAEVPTGPAAQAAAGIVVRLGASVSREPIDGRLLLLVAKDASREPRFQVSATSLSSAQVFGIDVDGLKARRRADRSTPRVLGYPIESLSRLPPGEYTVQALLHKYETFRLATGHTVKLPMDRGEGQQWNSAPGNVYSAPQKVRWDGGNGRRDPARAGQGHSAAQGARATPSTSSTSASAASCCRSSGAATCSSARTCCCRKDSTRTRTRAIRSSSTTATSPADLGNWRETPPDANLKCEYSERFQLDCYNRIQQQARLRVLQGVDRARASRACWSIEIQHANPYYDDSYAVNSANLGPYGDAIMKELVPHIESRFRGIGAGWARATYGGSTGGWEALAVQMFYPDDFNAAYAACPDPIDFRAFTVVDIYSDTNAYWADGPFMKVPRPGHRNYLGHAAGDARADEPHGAGARHQDAQRPAVGHLGGGLLAAGAGRLSGADLGQAHRRHRQERRRVLEGALRPRRGSCAATGTAASARSSRARSTSTSATWTTTI